MSPIPVSFPPFAMKEARATFPDNSSSTGTDVSKISSRIHDQTMITLVIISVSILILLAASILKSSTTDSNPNTATPPPPPPLHPLIKIACTHTLYPSLCLTTLSTTAHNAPSLSSDNTTTLHYFLEVAITHITKLVSDTRADIVAYLSSSSSSSSSSHEQLTPQEKNALNDCTDMMDQSLYELGQAIDDLRTYPESIGFLRRFYGNLKTLLSAAMTNGDTCIDGFSDLEESGSESSSSSNPNQESLRAYLQIQMRPISRMISNCLAIIRYMEVSNEIGRIRDRERFEQSRSSRGGRSGSSSSRWWFPHWMTNRDRRMLMGIGIGSGIQYSSFRADFVVARDGSGDFKTIGEAINNAPNNSFGRFVIRVKSGVYKEIVEIPRNKINIMLVGDGMNSTVITGSRSFLHGFSTFTSATLTVVGDRFLARDLTIVNTAGPDKHQAVALRVTSNSAFFRCNFSSHQDTLYAHSLRQFYRDCVIEGTIDFIFGNAAAIFQNCRIFVRKPIQGQKNMITAQGRDDPNQNTGISMQNCTIRASPSFSYIDRKVFATYLGRPWRNHSRTIIMKSYIGDLVHPSGWSKWNQYSTIDTVEYIEYMNFGPGSDTRRRVRWRGYKRNCTEDKAKQFTIGALLRGSDDWLVTTGFPLFYGA